MLFRSPSVPEAVAVERRALAGIVAPHRIGGAALVDVVAEVQDEVDAARDHRAPGVVVALLVALAARDAYPQAVEPRTGLGRGPSAAHRARGIARHEAVEILAAGPQARDLEVHAVGVLRGCGHDAALHAMREARIERDLPTQRQVVRARTAVRREGLWREPRPEHHAIAALCSIGNGVDTTTKRSG